ncbi:hypothetical protein KP509_22G033900 [Ceratopteris richardii]|uniref:Uncharacterized protein n=1 Tax=Ceratopteris richardii TaxID=49495 RepID=A0A8T2S3V3_CERRI|nr:hypothetical protein KP509_22G033900 [Ceratopteris richardii]
MSNVVSETHALGALLGLFVGDAAGATLEFSPRPITEEMAKRSMHMPGGGVLRVGPGQITDDSELAISLSRALSFKDPRLGLPVDAIARSYAEWLQSNPFDVGSTCYSAFSSYSSSSRSTPADCLPIREATPNARSVPLEVKPLELELLEDGSGAAMMMRSAAARYSIGSEANGSLMRIVPMAIWLAGEPDNIIAHAAKEDALLSHPSPVCQECSAAYTLAVAHLLTHPGDQSGALKLVTDYAENYMHTRAKQWLLDESLDVSSLRCTSRVGHVRYAFTLAFFFLRQGTSFEDAICLTLQKGGDTDTNAAIVGGMVGALHGAECIPTYMKNVVLSFDCTSCDRGKRRPSIYSAKHIEELLAGLLHKHK